MHRDSVARREHNKIVFERLWRGTFQAVLAGPRRPRASSHDPNPDMSMVPTLGHNECNMADSLEPALRTILAACLRPNNCCCRCNCASDRNHVNNLQVCPSAEERKNLRSVISVRETHAVAEAQQEKNARLRDAFGISPRFVEGTSLDPERRAREEAQKYPLVRTPSHEKEQRDQVSKKKKKRSASPEVKRSKKKKSKKNKKEKNESGKKKKKRSKSSDSDSSTSSEGSDSESSADDRQKKKKKDSHLYLKK